jgi:hypothetical protein
MTEIPSVPLLLGVILEALTLHCKLGRTDYERHLHTQNIDFESDGRSRV